MTAARDSRGRFITADEAAATRVLEAGVREAVRLLRAGIYRADVTAWDGTLVKQIRATEADHRHLATRVLADAGRAADLLLTTNGADQ